jgi:hypothetical protein
MNTYSATNSIAVVHKMVIRILVTDKISVCAVPFVLIVPASIRECVCVRVCVCVYRVDN